MKRAIEVSEEWDSRWEVDLGQAEEDSRLVHNNDRSGQWEVEVT